MRMIVNLGEVGIHSRSSDEAEHDLGNKNKMDIVGQWVELFSLTKIAPSKTNSSIIMTI